MEGEGGRGNISRTADRPRPPFNAGPARHGPAGIEAGRDPHGRPPIMGDARERERERERPRGVAAALSPSLRALAGMRASSDVVSLC